MENEEKLFIITIEGAVNLSHTHDLICVMKKLQFNLDLLIHCF